MSGELSKRLHGIVSSNKLELALFAYLLIFTIYLPIYSLGYLLYMMPYDRYFLLLLNIGLNLLTST